MHNSTVTQILADFISLIYPRYCVGCNGSLVKGEELLCTHCLLELPKTDYHTNPQNSFYQKMSGRIPVKFVMAQLKFVKESKVQNLLHNLKYKNHPEIAVSLGRMYGQELLYRNYKNEFDIIIPVPLHKVRKRKRGYNQSEEFGKGLSEVLQIPCSDEIVKRVLKTETQTKKTKLKRWNNVSEVFQVIKPQQIHNKRILLVDDVITTGATLEACAKVLLEANCEEVSIACIAAAQ